ncbi:MAG: hypothetical protein JWN63_2828 [Candidatus Acidoferrum typicum]|nr:hypothetical protein [Candidatus Acidoferrum typicum]
MRVIFDRSAFHGANFTALANSPLRDLVASGRISVFHTPVFLEETILSYGSKDGSDDWRAHLAFAVEVCNGGIFLAKDEIWHNELVRDHGPAAQHLHPNHYNRLYESLPSFLQTLRGVAESGDLGKDWLDSQAEREAAQEKKTNQKGIFRELREEIADALKAGRIDGRPRDYPFSEFLKSQFNRTGRQFMSIVDAERSEALARQWAHNPARFPYYSAFIEGVLYSAYYAMIEHNLRLDRNAQADFEQLAYLLWADVVVSNDERFFRSAFQTLWAPHGRRMESVESFTTLVRELT